MTKIITLDGPSGSGKGTVGRALAIDLGFDYLDSGLLYRSLALNALINNLDLNDEFGIAATVDDVSCLLYTSPSPRDESTSRMPSSA